MRLSKLHEFLKTRRSLEDFFFISLILSFSYNLSPENAFPAPINDCHATTVSLLGDLNSYGLSNVDLDGVILAGDSAGIFYLSFLSLS